MKKIGAFVVGDKSCQTTPLFDVGRDVGFASLQTYTGLSMVKQQVERTPLCFFLCAEVINPIVLSPILNEIRTSARRRIRFAPIVYFCESPSTDTIALCSALGFDDVLTTPFTPHRVAARLFRLISHPQSYVQTASYFGPRRKGITPDTKAQNGPAEKRYFDFKRDENAGIVMTREDAQHAA